MRTLPRFLFAALITTSGSAALADSQLMIYGRINNSIEHQKVGGKSVLAMVNNNSRIGFWGRENLGNGLKAGFGLEAGFQSDTGAGMLSNGGISFGRKSNVYLMGDFGKLQMGRAGGSSYDYVADYGVLDQPNHDTGSVSDAIYQSVGRSTNGISYSTPTLNGLTVEAALSMHEKEPESTRKNSFDLSANWALGDVSLGAGYTKHGQNRQWGLRVHYTLQDFQIGAYIQRVDLGSTSSTCNLSIGGCGTRNSGRINAMYAPGSSEFVIGYGWAGDWSNQDDSGTRQLMLGYNYNLSKRTKVYALYTKYNNDTHARYGYSFKSGVNFGQDARTFGIGVRHAF